jgi:hypothetical protein
VVGLTLDFGGNTGNIGNIGNVMDEVSRSDSPAKARLLPVDGLAGGLSSHGKEMQLAICV